MLCALIVMLQQPVYIGVLVYKIRYDTA